MNSTSILTSYDYEKEREFALNDPIAFWDQVASTGIVWDKKYTTVYKENGIYPGTWFEGGMVNTCYNLLDVHVKDELKRNKIAIIYECPFLKESIKLTYSQLYERVCEFSRVLLNLNISKDDKVIIQMPNTIETVIAMLSCNRIGATHCVLLDCHNVNSLVDKIDLICPKLIITANYGIVDDQVLPYTPILMIALELSVHEPCAIITFNRVHKDDTIQTEIISTIPAIPNSFDWNDQVLQCKSNPFYDYIPVDSNHPVYILFTSGTTGNSKAVVRNNGPHLVNIKYSSVHYVTTETKEPTVFFLYSSCGWLSFHNVLFHMLYSGDTTVFYEGSTTKPSNVLNDFWEIIERNKVTLFFTVPRLLKYTIKLDPEALEIKKYNLSSLNCIATGSEIVEQYTIDYLLSKLKVKVITGYGQTETGTMVLMKTINELESSAIQLKQLSFVKVSILSADGIEMCVNQVGQIAIKLPLFPTFISSFYKDEVKYKKLFEKHIGYYITGDLGYKNENGLFEIGGRIDDVVKVKGIQIELNKIEHSTFKHPLILDCCCVSIKSDVEGEVPIGILILKQQTDRSLLSIEELKQLKSEINSIITQDYTSDIILRNIVIVYRIPKTKTGKVVRSMISNVLNDDKFQIPNTFEEIDSLIEIKNSFKNNNCI